MPGIPYSPVHRAQFLAIWSFTSSHPGLFNTEVEAAIAYDREAVKQRGIRALTNFDLMEYADLLSQQARSQLRRLRSLVRARRLLVIPRHSVYDSDSMKLDHNTGSVMLDL